MKSEFNDKITFERFQNGDEEAFRELVIEYRGYMLLEGYYILKDFKEVEKIIVEVWKMLWKSRKMLIYDNSFLYMVLRIFREACDIRLIEISSRKRNFLNIVFNKNR